MRTSSPIEKVRLGVVGLGQAGGNYARIVHAGAVPRLELAAVCDRSPEHRLAFGGVRQFAAVDQMIGAGDLDAVLIATPHFSHTTLGMGALRAGLHVLIEKPISAHKADALALISAWSGREDRQVFGAMLNQRTDPYFRRIREMLRQSELGQIRRINWTVTTWFRPAAYYALSSWRATWGGEGGGVLLNQCLHNLDLLQWLFGMPRRLQAFCGFGRYHDIEVEDDVTAYLEYPDGATGVFVTSTGEAPGTNRLEIAAENGRLVYENDRLTFTRNAQPMTEFSNLATEPFGAPATTEEIMSFDDHGGQHREVLKNFADAILDGVPLIAPAPEGVHSVELANAMLLSAWTREAVALPLDAARYATELDQRIASSRFRRG